MSLRNNGRHKNLMKDKIIKRREKSDGKIKLGTSFHYLATIPPSLEITVRMHH